MRGTVVELSPGETIRLTRNRLKLSLRDLAQKSGVSAATISRMERDYVSTWKNTCLIADALNLDTEQIRYRPRGTIQ